MAFLTSEQAHDLKEKMSQDVSYLSKLYKARKNPNQEMSVEHNLVDDYVKDGWEIIERLKRKTKIRKAKDFDVQFEHEIWCQFYELGFRCLNIDERFICPWGKEPGQIKQLDVIAINKETAFVVECKSAQQSKIASFKEIADTISQRIDGITKAIRQLYGKDLKVKFIFATKNFRFATDSKDLERFRQARVFIYNENTQKYIDSLIKNYRTSAMYQFNGLVFRNELINTEKIHIPAVKGTMGRNTYYMFSIEPEYLLKIGFVLHRTRVNDFDFPTYQRLLVPSRLKGITKYIDDGGYFPNSIIINFNDQRHKIQFEASTKTGDSKSCFGTLKIPNAYAIAYIIDGQHRVYGYAGSKFKKTNTVPVVAFEGMSSEDQLGIFMDINENQKAVSPSLRLDLEEDLYWKSDRLDSRLKALRSSIIKAIANDTNSPLYNKISVGEDKELLSFKPFAEALNASLLLPRAKGSKFTEDSCNYAIYDTNESDHDKAMKDSRQHIKDLLIKCYSYVADRFPKIFAPDSKFILSNRGTYGFICLLGSIHRHIIDNKSISRQTTIIDRVDAMTKYIHALCEYLNTISEDEKEKMFDQLGQGADTKWLRMFQQFVHKKYPEYYPQELIEWEETQNEVIQEEARKLGITSITTLKQNILSSLIALFGADWEFEIASIKRECITRASKEEERKYKDGIRETVDWKDVLSVSDFKTIIEKFWSKTSSDTSYIPFEKRFAFDIGEGFHTKAEKLKWLSHLNSYKDVWSSGTKKLTKKELERLRLIHNHLVTTN